MNIVYTLLLAFPLGFLIRDRAAACALYLAGGAFVLAFQSVNLLVEWADGSTSAFGGPFPGHEQEKVIGYGLVNLAITAVGIGLVLLGALVARRRRSSARVAP